MIFAIVLVHNQLVSIARLKSCHLHPSDLYVLINLVNSSDSFKGVESWVPICLPKFDSGLDCYFKRNFFIILYEIFRGCLHAYISYLDESCDICLILMSVNPEHFRILSEFRQRIEEVRFESSP